LELVDPRENEHDITKTFLAEQLEWILVSIVPTVVEQQVPSEMYRQLNYFYYCII